MYKRILSALIVPTLFLSASLPAQPQVDSLKAFQWKNRIVLIKADADVGTYLNQIEGANLEIADRDILWFLISNDATETNYSNQLDDNFSETILDRYFRNANTQAVLIGKDGGVKDVSDELNLSELFALIDGMPMRRAELREDSNQP